MIEPDAALRGNTMTDQNTVLDESALEALARAYDKEEAAQRGEPDPWAFGNDDGPWREERLACAQVAAEAYLASLPSTGVKVKELADQLREAAKKATPGPWFEGDKWVFVRPVDPENNPTAALRSLLRDVPEEELQANCAYIALCSPDNILSLLSCITPSVDPAGTTRDEVARAIHAVDCFDANKDRQLEGLPPVEEWADPWLPSGKHQLDGLMRRADVFLAALLARLRAGAQERWKLVPVEPTEAMIDAHFVAHAKAESIFADPSDIWRAMLAAAPSPAKEGGR
jgi:hypothetical protein